jgi:hypothetical protein
VVGIGFDPLAFVFIPVALAFGLVVLVSPNEFFQLARGM